MDAAVRRAQQSSAVIAAHVFLAPGHAHDARAGAPPLAGSRVRLLGALPRASVMELHFARVAVAGAVRRALRTRFAEVDETHSRSVRTTAAPQRFAPLSPGQTFASQAPLPAAIRIWPPGPCDS
jgi:hypothetical protein